MLGVCNPKQRRTEAKNHWLHKLTALALPPLPFLHRSSLFLSHLHARESEWVCVCLRDRLWTLPAWGSPPQHRDEKPDCWCNTAIHSRSLRALKCFFKFRYTTTTNTHTHPHAHQAHAPAPQSTDSHVAAVISLSSCLWQKLLLLKKVRQTPAVSESTLRCRAVFREFYYLFYYVSSQISEETGASHQRAIKKFWLCFLEICWLQVTSKYTLKCPGVKDSKSATWTARQQQTVVKCVLRTEY